MDPSIDTIHGPYVVNKQTGTVTIPHDLLGEIGLVRGDRVHWILNPDMPGTLSLIPSVMVNRSMSEVVEILKTRGK